MSSTATGGDRALDKRSGPAAPSLVPPPKLRRRPALVVAAVVAVCVGALLAAWAWTATTNTQEVLVARTTLERGSVITADDIARVRVNGDPALRPVAASQFDRVVGQRAAVDVAAGALLTPDSFTSSVVPEDGNSIVGVALKPEQAPGVQLQAGDQVRIVVTPAQGEAVPAGAPQFSQAEVAGVHVSEETGETVVDLLVPHADAVTLAARAATGNVALVLDSRER